MKPQYLLILALLLVADIFAYTEVTALIRQPSDASVILGVALLAVFILVNYITIRYCLSKLNA